MKAKLVLGASVVAAASLLLSAKAEAADTGSLGAASKGSLIISADRLFGVTWMSQKDKFTEPVTGRTTESKYSATKFGLLWGDSSTPAGVNPYAIPRAAIDFLVIDGLTIGGSLGFVSGSSKISSTDATGVTREYDGSNLTEFVFAPRVGYILGFSPNVGLWLRGGFTYWSASSKTPSVGSPASSTTTFNGFGLNLEPTLMLAPVEHFAFTIGAVGDIGLTGKRKHESTNAAGTTTIDPDHDFTLTNLGLVFGILGWL